MTELNTYEPLCTKAATMVDSFDGQHAGLCQALQEELEVVQSIFPEYIYGQRSGGTLKLDIPIEFETAQRLTITNELNTGPSSSSLALRKERITVSVLPSIILHITLPPSYPLHGPPDIISLQATHEWLENVEDIKHSLLKMYEPTEHTIYNWIEYLRGGEFLTKSNSSGIEEEAYIGLSHWNPELLALTLVDFETSYKLMQFSQNSYPCSICLTSLKGTKCIRLECSHIFCRECLEDFWSMYIKEGDISRIGCPDPDCVKEGKESCEEEVARIVSSSQLERWRSLRKRRELEQDPSTMHCPRKQCQNLVPKPKGIDPNSGWERFRQCSRCQFTFCSVCQHAWHGPLSSCPASFVHSLVIQYLANGKNSDERKKLELIYGRTFLERILNQHKQEKETEKWISSSATACPGCASPVQKSGGCNHMTCIRCSNHFCYRCGQKLDPKAPYAHFSVKGTSCFQKVFDYDDR